MRVTGYSHIPHMLDDSSAHYTLTWYMWLTHRKKLRYEEASGKTLEERRETSTDREAKQERVLCYDRWEQLSVSTATTQREKLPVTCLWQYSTETRKGFGGVTRRKTANWICKFSENWGGSQFEQADVFSVLACLHHLATKGKLQTPKRNNRGGVKGEKLLLRDVSWTHRHFFSEVMRQNPEWGRNNRYSLILTCTASLWTEKENKHSSAV